MIRMASKVVSTKLTEEEYGKLVGLCSKTGYTVSKLLKRAILERMNEQSQTIQTHKEPQPEHKIPEPTASQTKTKNEERFLYY